MKKVYLLISLFIIVILVFSIYYKKNTLISVSLDKCIDGDTAWFKINNERKKYRFLAIDTMETNTEFGITTKEYVCNLLKDAEKIEIEYDKLGENKDKYNRELVWVYIDNILLQEKLISEGYAEIKYVYYEYEYLEELKNKEQIAKENNLGIWKIKEEEL